MDFCLNLDGAKEIDIEDDDDNVVATFRIFEDEHGWLWVVTYADKRRPNRAGRL